MRNLYGVTRLNLTNSSTKICVANSRSDPVSFCPVTCHSERPSFANSSETCVRWASAMSREPVRVAVEQRAVAS
jgi:hypothetical protein